MFINVKITEVEGKTHQAKGKCQQGQAGRKQNAFPESGQGTGRVSANGHAVAESRAWGQTMEGREHRS